jgi:CDP-paratose 2-epimerase
MTVLVTGSNGLVGGEVVAFFAERRREVIGVDNNMRATFFGPEADTRWNQTRLLTRYPGFSHRDLDIRDRAGVGQLVSDVRPTLVVHAAAQPSHDLSVSRPFDDFDVNAVGTLNLLEAVRRHVPHAVFVYLSTNKIYGDAPNRIRLRELPTRWDYDDPEHARGIAESCSVDQSRHSLFGASKLAADVLVQEYGRGFGLRSCCLRSGCITGATHGGVELHGFLSYLVRANVERRCYRVYGYKGKQVRDNIHARDVARFIECFDMSPRVAEVYNIGGGRPNSCSILEALEMTSIRTGLEVISEYVETPRAGDHICYVSDLSKLQQHYPEWAPAVSLPQILDELVGSWNERLAPV